MRKFRLLLIFFGLVFQAGRVLAQDAVLARFDKPFYVAGEVAWYQLFLPDRLHGVDFSIKLTVFDQRGTPVDELFLETKGNTLCAGHYLLPFDLVPGYYRFSFSALPENRAETELVLATVPVYHDLKPLPATFRLVAAPEPEPAGGIPDSWSIQVLPEGGRFADRGQETRLQIMVTDANGNPVKGHGCVAVRDEGLTGVRVYADDATFAGPALPANAVFRSGIFQAGTVSDAAGQPLQAPLLIALDVETGLTYFTESDRDGRFLLSVPRHTGRRRFQILEPGGTAVQVTWDKRNLPALGKEAPYTSGVLDYLEISRQRRKIYQLFGAVETALPETAPDAMPAAVEFDRSFQVQDYERFPDLFTFFREVAWMVRFTPGKTGYTANMYDFTRKQYFESPPLFLVDGKATSDAAFVGQLKPADVAAIDLLYDTKRLRRNFPGLRAGGVVRIVTLRGNREVPPETEAGITALPGVQPPVIFPPAAPAEGLPRLGPLVHWQPAWATDEQGAGLLAFRQNDGPGRFCVEVVLQSEDGRRGTGRFCYSVK